MTDSGWNDIRRDRLVKNELAFRDYNNRRVGFEHSAGDAEAEVEEEVVPFVCECGNSDCISAVNVTIGHYEDVHSAPNRFIVRPEHVYPDVEQVIERHRDHWVVEKYPDEMPPVNA